jgi:outer membrane protein assembly factor BamA
MEVSARALGGNVSTVRSALDFRQFIPTGGARGEPRVIGLRARVAHIAATGPPLPARALSVVGGVPIPSRFFLGGEGEVRGYEVNSIAPLARVERFLIIGDHPPARIASDIRPVGGTPA